MRASDIYIESGKEALEHIRNFRKIARKVKEIVTSRHPEARVLVFGSALRGDYTAASDIDILIVADLDDREKVELKVDIRRALGLSVPVEIHVASPGEFEEWYSRFIGEYEEVN